MSNNGKNIASRLRQPLRRQQRAKSRLRRGSHRGFKTVRKQERLISRSASENLARCKFHFTGDRPGNRNKTVYLVSPRSPNQHAARTVGHLERLFTKFY
jgi:hypothetical protein